MKLKFSKLLLCLTLLSIYNCTDKKDAYQYEFWIFSLEDCHVSNITMKPGDKENPDAEEPLITIKKENPNTGEYEEVSGDGFQDGMYYDKLHNTLQDDNPEIALGFQINYNFIEKERIELFSEVADRSIFNWNILSGNLVRGIITTFNIFDRTGKEKEVMFQVECFNRLISTKDIVKSQQIWSKLSVLVYLMLLIMMTNNTTM